MKLLFSLLCLVLGACSTPDKLACVSQDWYEVARTVAAQGKKAHNLQTLFNQCSNGDEKQAQVLYVNGRNAGLSRYCDPENGFELGRVNVPYNSVCPKDLEDDFLSSYGKGQHFSRLKNINRNLKEKIKKIKSKWVKGRINNDVLFELKKMRQQVEKNQRALTVLRNKFI